MRASMSHYICSGVCTESGRTALSAAHWRFHEADQRLGHFHVALHAQMRAEHEAWFGQKRLSRMRVARRES